MNTAEFIKVIASFTVSMLTLLIFIVLLYRIRSGRNSRQKHAKLVYITVGYSLDLCIFFLLRAINVLLYHDDWKSVYHARATVGYILAALYVLFGVLFVAFVLSYVIMEVHTTFKDTNYRVAKTILCLHVFTSAMSTTGILIGGFLFYFVDAETGRIVMGVCTVTNSLNALHCLYLFNRNLFLLVLSQRQTVMMNTSGHRMSSIDEANIALIAVNERQLSIIAVITRNAVLISLVMLVFAVFMVLYFISTELYSVWMESLAEILFALFAVWSCVSMALSLTVNRSIYNVLCRQCDTHCKQLCTRLAQRSMMKESLSGRRKYEDPELQLAEYQLLK